MKILMKTWVLSLIVAGSLLPITTYADQGVIIEEYQIKDERGMIINEFQIEDKIRIEREDGSNFLIETNDGTRSIPKSVALKTVEETEVSFTVKSDIANIYNEPSLFSASIQSVEKGDLLIRIPEQKEKGNWIKIIMDNHMEGWINKNHLQVNYEETPVTTTAYVKSHYSENEKSFERGDKIQLANYKNGKYIVSQGEQHFEINKSYVVFEEPKASILSERSADLIDYAYEELGKPYVWGAVGETSYDCSGFTKAMFSKIGISLPRTAAEQSLEGMEVSETDLLIGDLVFFTTYAPGASHVGIYIGDGKMIHAGGEEVKISSLSLDYWKERYLFAKRIE